MNKDLWDKISIAERNGWTFEPLAAQLIKIINNTSAKDADRLAALSLYSKWYGLNEPERIAEERTITLVNGADIEM